MTLSTLPLWILYSAFLMGIVIAVLTILFEEFRDEFVIPGILFVTIVKFLIAMSVLLLVIIQRTFP